MLAGDADMLADVMGLNVRVVDIHADAADN
jgi:hypothetical protein